MLSIFSGVKTAYILGAGFSLNAGIPIQSNFLHALRGKSQKVASLSPIDRLSIDAIKTYSSNVFGDNPELEDIFTCLDLSANTGHHLGKDYYPARLRSLRRVLISRIIKIVSSRYRQRPLLKQFMDSIDPPSSAFISLNWDTVIERELIRIGHKEGDFYYGCDEVQYYGKATKSANHKKINICKVHGSTNWLYCDNCRLLHVLPVEEEIEIPLQVLKKKDLQSLSKNDKYGALGEYKSSEKFKCRRCATILGTRMATFSYRKILDSPILAKSWFSAERLLSTAEQWVFIGYSLPAADFEFKYMLKRVEQAAMNKKRIIVVTMNDADNLYRRFFNGLRNKDIYCNGLEEYVSAISK